MREREAVMARGKRLWCWLGIHCYHTVPGFTRQYEKQRQKHGDLYPKVSREKWETREEQCCYCGTIHTIEWDASPHGSMGSDM